MTAADPQVSDIPCDRCGYDLRAHPPEGKCPECGASVAASLRLAAFPRRPAWRDSDPRWRRRMLAGAWILALLPLMDALKTFGWASTIPVPTVFNFRGGIRTLDDTFVSLPGVYVPLMFCIGVVLLFSKERHRRRHPLDWTRRWGVMCSYLVLLLSAIQVLFIAALVSAGIAMVFQSIPPKYQPQVTPLLVELSTSYLRFVTEPTNTIGVVLLMFSSVVILLACVRLFDALRCSGSKNFALILLSSLAFFSLMNLFQVVRYWLGDISANDVLPYGVYFWPALIVRGVMEFSSGMRVSGLAVAEILKWCIVLVIAVWLSIAQIGAWRAPEK